MTDMAPLPASHIFRPIRIGAIAIAVFLGLVVAWSVMAPLSTSIHVSGQLASARPSFALQHAYGGTVAQVTARAQQEIAAGDLLMVLDTHVEQVALEEVHHQLGLITRESAVVEQALHDPAMRQAPLGDTTVAEKYAAEERAFLGRSAGLSAHIAAQGERVRGIEREVLLMQQRREILAASVQRQETLQAAGLGRDADLDQLRAEMLRLAEDLALREADALATRSEMRQSRSDLDELRANYRAALYSRLEDNAVRASRLRSEAARLEAVLARSEIRAPVSGHLQKLPYDAPGMYLPQGATLAEIAQELEAPELRLRIPLQSIDQVRVGMTGRLTLSSMPQREAPPMHVTLTAIAPEAEQDREGQPTAYPATAVIHPEDAEALSAMMGAHLRLSADMPVSVVLTGRQTTLAQYLVAPFLTAFGTALQD